MEHERVVSETWYPQGAPGFACISGDLVNISFDPSVDPQEQMRDFPLGPGESWSRAIHDPHQVYVCIRGPMMGAKQAAWLLKHEVAWAYVEARAILW